MDDSHGKLTLIPQAIDALGIYRWCSYAVAPKYKFQRNNYLKCYFWSLMITLRLILKLYEIEIYSKDKAISEIVDTP